MKTKAQMFYNSEFRVTQPTGLIVPAAYVKGDKVTQPTCELTSVSLSIRDALRLRDWLTDTFDIPNKDRRDQ